MSTVKTILALALSLSACFLCAPSNSTEHLPNGVLTDLPSIKQAFIKGSVVPDVLTDFEPVCAMTVLYEAPDRAGTVLVPGQQVPIGLTLQQPEIFLIAPNGGFPPSLLATPSFTFIMADPDAPSRVNPTMGGFRHMLAINVHLEHTSEPSILHLGFTGDEVSPYSPPMPPAGTRFHRYTFLLYPGEPATSSIANFTSPDASRIGFNVANFTKAAGLKSAVAGTYMQVDNAADEESTDNDFDPID